MHDWTWFLRSLSALLGLAAAVVLYRALLHDRARGRRRCPRCWYDMAGARSLLCPECGREARSEQRLFRTRRRYGRAGLAAGLGLLSYTAAVAPLALATGSWWSAVPMPVVLIVLQFYDKDGDQLLKTAGNAAMTNPGSLSRFERLLLARAAAKLLARPLPSNPAGRPRRVDVAEFENDPEFQSYVAEQSRRSQAVMMLSMLGDDARPAIPELLKLMATKDFMMRAQIPWCLGRIGAASPEVLGALAAALDDNDHDLRVTAVLALEQMATPPPTAASTNAPSMTIFGLAAAGTAARPGARAAAVKVLVRGLSAADAATRRAAAQALGHVAPPNPAFLPALAESVRDPNLSTGEVGVAAIAQFGEPSAAILCELLVHLDRKVRRTAASWLGLPGHPAPHAGRPLSLLLSDTDTLVRLSAAAALARIGPDARDALPAIAASLEHDTVAQVRVTAIIAAGAIAGRTDDAVPIFMTALSDADPIVRRAAADALAALGPTARAAAATLAAHAKDPDSDARGAIAAALRAVQTPDPSTDPDSAR